MAEILIIFASRYGSTKEIAERISKVLGDNDLDTRLINLKSKQIMDPKVLKEADGILIASGIKIGSWVKEARQFLEDNSSILRKKQEELGIFVSCGEAGVPDKIPGARKKYIEDVAQEHGINPVLYEAFAGVYDFSKTSNVGFLGRKALKMVTKKDPNLKLDYEKRNDLRNWNTIEEFAKSFADLVKK